MITLSDRLLLMAEQISTGETVADIGTDHGFLPIYLLQKGTAKKVIMADISPGSLEKARTNFERFFPCESEACITKESYDFRLGNGLSVLGIGEADSVIIAGMGGILISEILGADMEKSRSVGQFVLQPRNGQGRLRRWLYNNGFSVKKELLVREGKFICEVLAVTAKTSDSPGFPGPGEGCEIFAGDIRFEVPRRLIEENGELGLEFARRRLGIEKQILADMEKGGSTADGKRERQLDRIAYLSGLL